MKHAFSIYNKQNSTCSLVDTILSSRDDNISHSFASLTRRIRTRACYILYFLNLGAVINWDFVLLSSPVTSLRFVFFSVFVFDVILSRPKNTILLNFVLAALCLACTKISKLLVFGLPNGRPYCFFQGLTSAGNLQTHLHNLRLPLVYQHLLRFETHPTPTPCFVVIRLE